MLSRPGFETTSRAPIRRSVMHLILAGVLAAMFVAAGVVYMTRPATLRIAVGPAGSDDAKVVQTIAQVLARERGNVGLRSSRLMAQLKPPLPSTTTRPISPWCAAIYRCRSPRAPLRRCARMSLCCGRCRSAPRRRASLRKRVVLLLQSARSPTSPDGALALSEKRPPILRSSTSFSTSTASPRKRLKSCSSASAKALKQAAAIVSTRF